MLDKASEAKLPGSSESDVFQYNNSTCAVDLIDKDKSGNENEKWKWKMKNEALVARLVLIVLYFLCLGFSGLIVLWMMKYD